MPDNVVELLFAWKSDVLVIEQSAFCMIFMNFPVEFYRQKNFTLPYGDILWLV